MKERNFIPKQNCEHYVYNAPFRSFLSMRQHHLCCKKGKKSSIIITLSSRKYTPVMHFRCRVCSDTTCTFLLFGSHMYNSYNSTNYCSKKKKHAQWDYIEQSCSVWNYSYCLPITSNVNVANTTVIATATTEDGVGTIIAVVGTIIAIVGGVDGIGDTADVTRIKLGTVSHLRTYKIREQWGNYVVKIYQCTCSAKIPITG